jgi:hypothetical protein
MKINVFITIGSAGVCFIISWLSFESNQEGIGWLFLLVGIAIVVFGVIYGNKSG